MTGFGVSLPNLFLIILYTVVTIFGSKFIVRHLAIIYSSYSVYHYCDQENFRENCSEFSDQRESLIDKIKMVAGSNALMSLFTIILIISLHYLSVEISTLSSVIPVTISVNMVVSLAIMASIFNTSLRISAFGVSVRENENLSDKRQKRVRNKIISFGFSFWVTLYFLIIIGIGTAVITGNPSLELPGFEGGFVQIIGLFSIAIFIAPGLGAIVSELSLYYIFSIPDSCQECKSV